MILRKRSHAMAGWAIALVLIAAWSASGPRVSAQGGFLKLEPLPTAHPEGVSISTVGDLDGDGTDDYAVHARNGTGLSPVTIHSGSDDRLLLTIAPPAGQEPGFVQGIAGIPDLDRDGVPDLVCGTPLPEGFAALASDSGLVYRSGATGVVLQRVRSGVNGARFGHHVLRISDLNADGFDDLIVTTRGAQPECPTGGPNVPASAGRVEARSGRDGRRLWSVVGTPGQRIAEDVLLTPDRDRDGIPEVLQVLGGSALAALPCGGSTGPQLTQLTLRSGRSGGILGQAGYFRVLSEPRLALGGDFDGDGREDYVISGVDQFRNPPTPVSFAVSSTSLMILWTVRGADAWPGPSLNCPDLNADGRPDLFVRFRDGSLGWRSGLTGQALTPVGSSQRLATDLTNELSFPRAWASDLHEVSDRNGDGRRDWLWPAESAPNVQGLMVVASGPLLAATTTRIATACNGGVTPIPLEFEGSLGHGRGPLPRWRATGADAGRQILLVQAPQVAAPLLPAPFCELWIDIFRAPLVIGSGLADANGESPWRATSDLDAPGLSGLSFTVQAVEQGPPWRLSDAYRLRVGF